MNKENLIKTISKETGIKKKKTGRIFNRVMALISVDLKKKKEVSIDGFGDFKIKRVEMKILYTKNKTKNIYPPKDIIEFVLDEGLTDKFNTNE